MAMVLLSWLAAGILRAGAITLAQPNGGESLVLGSENYPIKWSAADVGASVRIRLLRNGTAVGAIVSSVPANSSPFLWKVGRLASGAMVEPGQGYTVKILAIDGDEVAESAAPFAIVESPPLPPPPPPVMLRLEAPNGGESYFLRHDCPVSWKSISPAQVGSVRLELLNSGGGLLGTVKDGLPSTGTWTWKAGEYNGATAAAGSYRLRVRSQANAAIRDDSDAAFELKGLHAKVGKAQRMPVQMGVTLSAAIQNYPCRDTFPGNMTAYVPGAVFQQGWQQLFGASCGNPTNQYAQAGVYWFAYENYSVAAIYRSRIIFFVGEYAGQGASLKSAKLKMKRVHSIHEDAGSGCGCQENIWVLNAPMNDYRIPAVGQRIDVDLGAGEFTRDVTAIVRQWLDGTLANNGLLVLAGELPCSGGRKCASCYEASLILEMQ
jgi:hypothetical protein